MVKLRKKAEQLNELSKRSLVGVIGIPLALIVIYFGSWYFATVVILLSVMALWEYYALAERKNARPAKYFGLVMNVAMLLNFYLFFDKGYFAIVMFIQLSVLFVGSMLIQLYMRNEQAIVNLATTVAGVLYMTFLLGPLLLLREFSLVIRMFDSFGMSGKYLNDPVFLKNSTWGVFVIIIFFAIWICDSAAYFIGKAYGKNSLFERISPKKTWEGAIAGFFFAVLSFYTFSLFLLPELPSIHAIVLGIIVGTAGQIGDLAESQLKRDAEVKDSSDLIPGHGGVLDRFDSIMFVSPIILIYLLLSNI